MEESKVKIDMTKKDYRKQCHRLKTHSRLGSCSNIFSFLCIIIPLPVGSKYALKVIQLPMEVQNILTILLCSAVAFIMFSLSLIGLALFVTNLLYKDFFQMQEESHLHYEVFFRPTDFCINNGLEDVIIIEYRNCHPIYNCTYGISVFYSGVNNQNRVFYFPEFLFPTGERQRIYEWQKPYLSRVKKTVRHSKSK